MNKTSTIIVLDYTNGKVDVITDFPLSPLSACEDVEAILENYYNLDAISWMELPEGAGYEDAINVINYSEL